MTTKLGILLLCAGMIVGTTMALVFGGGRALPAQSEALLDNHALAANVETFVLPVSQVSYLPIRDFNIPDPMMHARSALLVDRETGRTLYALNPDQHLPIASVTKLMSAAIILERLSLDDEYTADAEDLNVDGLGADLHLGEKMRGMDLFKMMLIKSSNDAAFIFAAAARKRGLDFVGLMNQKASELGMGDTYFNDPARLDDASTHSSASNLLKLIQYINDRYPVIWETLTIPEADVASSDGAVQHRVVNTNRLLGAIPHIVGGKTGNTDGALGTMVLVAGVSDRGGVTPHALVRIELGSGFRFGETQTLINWGKRVNSWEP